jgi:hypothetical protein
MGLNGYPRRTSRRTRIDTIVDGYCRIAGPVERRFRQEGLRAWPSCQVHAKARSRDTWLSTMVKTAPFAPIALACSGADGIITRWAVVLELPTTSARLVRQPSTSLGIEPDRCRPSDSGTETTQTPSSPDHLPPAGTLSGAPSHPRSCGPAPELRTVPAGSAPTPSRPHDLRRTDAYCLRIAHRDIHHSHNQVAVHIPPTLPDYNQRGVIRSGRGLHPVPCAQNLRSRAGVGPSVGLKARTLGMGLEVEHWLWGAGIDIARVPHLGTCGTAVGRLG